MHAYTYSLFSLWSFHLFSKCFALLNILTFPWTILLQEINVFFKWFISFSIDLGTKIKLTFSENKGAVELVNIYSEIKILCLLRAQSLLKNKHHRPPEKEEKPPADTFSHWLMILSWQSSFRNGNQGTNGMGFIQSNTFYKRKGISNFKELH